MVCSLICMCSDCGRVHSASQDCGIGPDSMAAGLPRFPNARRFGANARDLAYEAPAEVPVTRCEGRGSADAPEERLLCRRDKSACQHDTPIATAQQFARLIGRIDSCDRGSLYECGEEQRTTRDARIPMSFSPKSSRWQIWEDSSRASHINEDPSLPPPNVPEDVRDISCGVDGLGNLAEHARGHEVVLVLFIRHKHATLRPTHAFHFARLGRIIRRRG